MVLRQQKVRGKPGKAEFLTAILAVTAVAAMLAGPMLIPGTDWNQAEGRVVQYYRYQHATNPDGRPYRVRLDYKFVADGMTYEGHWDGAWPETHSPNALLSDELDRLKEDGYALVVSYDPLDPSRNTLHEIDNRAQVWWLRISVALAALVLWFVFVVYPRLKRSAQSGR